MDITSKQKNILLVEDEPVTARLTGEMLRRQNYEVDHASSGEEAIRRLQDHPADLILMDIDLGEGRIDGTETARQILSRHDLPIVFHTSHSEKEMVERVKGITRYGYVLKNSGEFVLRESICMAFQLFESHRKTRESEDRLLQITTNLEDVVYEYDPKDDRFLYVSPSYETIWERPLEDIYREAVRLPESIHPDDLPAFIQAMEREQQEKEFLDMQYRILTPDGKVKWIWSRNYPVLNRDGNHYRTVGMARDITREKVMEEELRKNNEEMTLMFDHSPVMMLLLDGNTRVRKANAFLEDFTGSPAEELIGKRTGEALRCVNHLTDPDGCGYGKECRTCRFRELILETFTTGVNHTRVEISLTIESEGKEQRAVFLVSTIRLHHLKEPLILVTVVDITGLRKIEKTLDDTSKKLLAISENTREAICILQGGHIVFATRRMEQLSGFSLDELLTRPFVEFIHPEDRDKVLTMYHRRLTGEDVPDYYEFKGVRKDGGLKVFQVRGTTFDLKGQPATAAILIDITENRNHEKSLEMALREKDLLMKELNHRVKNNLSMISSMINLKALEMGDENLFSNLNNQIRAITLVHEILHQGGDVSHVNFKEYVKRLLETVFDSFSHSTVELDLDIQDAYFSSRTTVTLGLLVNEIATNAIKHGFIPGEQARFSIHLRKEGEGYLLTLSNNGRPFPGDVHLYNTETLGMSLISALSVRLQGKIELEKNPITTFTVTFPAD